MNSVKSGTASRDRLLLYTAIALGAFLRIFGLGSQSIWGDEALTIQAYLTDEHLADVCCRIWMRGVHPPLYFLIMHYWRMLGESEFMLRFPSAVFGVAAIPLIYLITRRMFGRPAAGISALVLAVSPFHIWYSQEARMYSLQMFLALASTLLLLRAWERRRAADLAAYGLVTVAALYTHIGTLFLLAAQGVITLGMAVKDWRRYASVVAVQSLVLAAYIPWIMKFVTHKMLDSGGPGIGFEREASPLHLAYGLYTFSVGYSLGPSTSALHYLSAKTAIENHIWGIAVPAVVFGLLVILGMMRAYTANRTAFWMLLGLLTVPFVSVMGAGLSGGIPMNPRYLIVALIPYWITLALGLQSSVRSRILPVAAGAILALSIYNYYFLPVYAKQDVRSAAHLVEDRARPGDVIIISSIELGGPFIYYFGREGIPYVGYPPRPGLVKPQMLGKDMERILNGKRRAWLVLGRTWSSDPQGLIFSSFSGHYQLLEYRKFLGVTVACFDLQSLVNHHTKLPLPDSSYKIVTMKK